MKYSFSIKAWSAFSPSLKNSHDWFDWAKKNDDKSERVFEQSIPLKTTKIPAMQARRMSIPSKLSVEVGLELLEHDVVDFAVFSSRHGELERTYNILSSLNKNVDISPTDFALSVHNSASGLFSIISKQEIPISSISASSDSFLQGLFEIYPLLQEGKKVLFIDFDGEVPKVYHTALKHLYGAYAVGFILEKGDDISFERGEPIKGVKKDDLPLSLIFLRCYLNQEKNFQLDSKFGCWQFELRY